MYVEEAMNGFLDFLTHFDPIVIVGKGAFGNVYTCRKILGNSKKYAAKIVECGEDNKIKWQTENEIEVCKLIEVGSMLIDVGSRLIEVHSEVAGGERSCRWRVDYSLKSRSSCITSQSSSCEMSNT